MTNPNDHAFPCEVDLTNPLRNTPGLTKREYFAAMAMQGILSSCDMECLLRIADLKTWKTLDQWLAANAVMSADALIAELNK
jgi:hypothetical protein